MKYSVGIDLGTSNSCVSICDLDGGYPTTTSIAQVLGPSVIGEKPLLPSAIYLPIENEFAPGALALPWDPDGVSVIGAFARERGALAPDRLVSSAKSWLCNPQVDRHAPILPWRSDLAEGKLSPFEASRRYLEHLRQALEQALAARTEMASLGDCTIVLTVPASFDEVARELTHQAAMEAGLGNVTLLEEPQAAFYAWIAGSESGQTPEHWSSEVGVGDLVLVCDVGGGTADFTLIAVAAAEAGLSQALELHRIAVGEHILLGGDNMDLALAYALKNQFSAEGNEIDHWQFLALIHTARAAKERLLSDAAIAEVPIAVPARGASLFAKTLSTTLSRAKGMALIIDGYFPRTEVTELPKARKSVGLQEFGLDYATEPAFSKHLARFLTRARENVRSDPALSQLLSESAQSGDLSILRPSAVLFNGGVFHAHILRERVLEVLGSWLKSGTSLKEIKGVGLDTAVALGAA
ncbi:MAG: Hsp70 family protein [Gammaproteobacteria bacterium]